MQKLSFEVLESTRNLPFKLPSDAVYILRVSAIIEGLGTTYIENFNGVKDILPILKDNMPKALGMKDSILEMAFDEIKSFPKFIQNLKTMVLKGSKGELEVLIHKDQLEFIKKDLKDYFGSYLKSLSFILFGIFLIFYDENLKNLALILVSLGFIRVWFIK